MPNLKLISATDTQYSTAVLKSMNDQRNHGLFCDVTIIIQDKKFRAHKTILSASSTYFHQLFSVAGQVIELNFIKAEIFEQILNYIYSSKIIRVRSDMLEELISAGQILGVKFIANLGQLLSQVKGLPGLSKDTESKSGASAKVMPIITESFSISAEEFNQTCKSGDDDDGDGDSDNDVMFVSETETAKAAETPKSPPGVIDLDGGAWEDAAPNNKPEPPSAAEAGGPLPEPEDATAAMLKTSPQVTPVTRPALSPNANANANANANTNANADANADASASVPSSPVRLSSAITPTTPSRPPHSLTPLSPNTPQPCDNSDMMGVQKKQVCTTAQQGDFKIRLSDMSSGRDAGPNFPPPPAAAAVVAKKTITLDKALEIDALSSGCKVYANIGENTYDIVPVKEDPDEGGSKLAKGKRALMATPLRPYDKSAAAAAAPPSPSSLSPPPPGASGKKKIKSELEDHYELIMDGKTFYVCMVCKRPYVCLTSLRRHFNTHSWEKKYPCRYCNKVFALAEYRTKHEAHHTGERRYQCLLCNEMFLNYQVLSTHCKQAHNQDPSGRKEKDDTPNNLYRLLPYKSHPAPPPPPPWPAAHEGGIRMIGEDGSVQHIMPGGGGGGVCGEEVQSSTQSKILNWNDIFVEPDARSRGPGPGMNPQQQQANPEFDFVIPETY